MHTTPQALAAQPLAPAPALGPVPGPIAGFTPEQRMLNRELSWLQFNKRVLRLATDDRTPLLDRVRFLAIFSTNLDEFIMKRVGGLKRQVDAAVSTRSFDGMTPAEQLEAIRSFIVDLQTEQAKSFANDIVPALAREGIELVAYQALTREERDRVDAWFKAHVFPVLTPLAVDPGHRFPFISNLSTSIGVLLTHPDQSERLFARVKLPAGVPQWATASPPGDAGPLRLVSLQDVVANNLDDLFPEMRIDEVTPFRVTRNAELDRDDADIDDLMETIEDELRQRRFARVVRLEAPADASPRILDLLVEELDLLPGDVYLRPGPLDYSNLFTIADLPRPSLKVRPWVPVVPIRLADEDADIFSAIRQGDILVHHPYESFAASVERFITAAARDPKVLAIKQTLYRTSADSPFVSDLIRAAEAGKQVACLVELRARFDEGANIAVAQRLEKAGVHVAYGVIGYKTHSKIALVVRQESDGLRCYAHIGTGNYNSKTAQLYTDLGLLTCDPLVTEDVVALFNYLTGRSRKREYNRLLVAPVTMKRGFMDLIDREAAIARSGGRGRIVAKMNALEDRAVMDRLYEASAAGVQIDLFVRGFCCLRAGVKGLSDNIRVVSTVGRFLEHSRIFHFGAGKDDPLDGEWWISSADWMYRNLSHRVEAAAPILQRDLRQRLRLILDTMLADHRCAWDLLPDASYAQRTPPPNAQPDSPAALGAFEVFMRDALVRNDTSQ
jgi:polyphosphate kinase